MPQTETSIDHLRLFEILILIYKSLKDSGKDILKTVCYKVLLFIRHILQELSEKTGHRQQIHKQTRSTFNISKDACLQNNVLRRKNIRSVIFNKFTFNQLKNA